MPSIVAEMGSVVEQHMKNIDMIYDPEMGESTRQLIADKRAAYEQGGAKKMGAHRVRDPVATAATETAFFGFPPGATLCAKCNTQGLVLMDGSQTCLNCGCSKCR